MSTIVRELAAHVDLVPIWNQLQEQPKKISSMVRSACQFKNKCYSLHNDDSYQ